MTKRQGAAQPDFRENFHMVILLMNNYFLLYILGSGTYIVRINIVESSALWGSSEYWKLSEVTRESICQGSESGILLFY